MNIDPAIAVAITGTIGLVVQYVLGVRQLRRRVAETRTETRRRLVDHLRRNQRGLILLDNAYLRDCKLEDLLVLGDYSLITNCLIEPRGDVGLTVERP